jgi:hypothetical protein
LAAISNGSNKKLKHWKHGLVGVTSLLVDAGMIQLSESILKKKPSKLKAF